MGILGLTGDRKCITCQHWTGNEKFMLSWDNANEFMHINGFCARMMYGAGDDYSKLIPKSAENSCALWEVKFSLKHQYEQHLKKEKEREVAREKERLESLEKERKLKEEENRLIKETEQGSMEAQFELGRFYKTNHRRSDASIWLQKAANQGHKEAENLLAVIEQEKTKEKKVKQKETIRNIKSSLIFFLGSGLLFLLMYFANFSLVIGTTILGGLLFYIFVHILNRDDNNAIGRNLGGAIIGCILGLIVGFILNATKAYDFFHEDIRTIVVWCVITVLGTAILFISSAVMD